MSTALTFLRTSAGPVQAIPLSDVVHHKSLTGTTKEDFTVPTGARFVFLSGSVAFSVRKNADAAWPAADVSDGTGSMLVPPDGILINCQNVTTISVAAAAGGLVSAAWFT